MASLADVVTSYELLPGAEMTDSQRLACFIRMAILITLLLLVVCWGSYDWLKFLACAAVIVFLLYFSIKP